MKEYIVTINENLTKSIIVEAHNEDDAKQIAQSIYDRGEIILYPEECDVKVDFEVQENIS